MDNLIIFDLYDSSFKGKIHFSQIYITMKYHYLFLLKKSGFLKTYNKNRLQDVMEMLTLEEGESYQIKKNNIKNEKK